MTDFTQFTNQELSEALSFHRRQRNMSRGINESAHARQTQTVRLLEAEEARRLEEAEKPTYHYYVTHNKGDKNSDWTVTHSKKKPFATTRDAADHIMKSGGRRGGTVHTVNAKTGNIVQARSYDSGQAGYARDPGIGDPRHIRDLKEEVGQIDEVSTEKLRDYASAALQDKNKDKADKRWKYAGKAMDKVADREVKAAHALKYNKTEEVELDELSNMTLQRYKSRTSKIIDNSDDSAEVKKRGKGYALASKKLTNRILKKEEAEQIDETSDLRITKIHHKWPMNETYAVHNADRTYFEEFSSIKEAMIHRNEKSSMKEEVFTEAKLERNKNTVGAHHLERDSGDHKMYTAYTGSLVRRLHTVTDKDDNILGQGSSAASAMAKAKLKKPHRDALMHDDNQIVNVHDTRGATNVGTRVTTPGKGKWFKNHDEAMQHAKSLPGKIRHADAKTGHVD